MDEKTINFRSLLQRLMQELVADEEKKADEKISQAVDEASREREKAKELRELRKKEALERSKQRQSDPNYFQQRKELNEEKLSVKSTQVAPSETISKSDSADDATEECSEMSSQDDPFRSYKNKSRSKIFVR